MNKRVPENMKIVNSKQSLGSASGKIDVTSMKTTSSKPKAQKTLMADRKITEQDVVLSE
jgi:hypothetical protein